MEKKTRSKLDRGFYTSLKISSRICCCLTVAALIGVILFVLIRGSGSISSDLLFGDPDDVENSLLPAFLGTLQLVFISMIIAVPLGVFTAVFLVEYMHGKGKAVKTIRIATETLSGIPSIVYGLFGYLIFVVAFGWGYSLLGGGITLATMILPTIVRSTEESLLSVPAGYREGAYALGTSKVKTIFKVILPSASGGIVTSIILAVGRVVSESAVLILTIGMVVDRFPTTAMSPGTSLALDIYYYANFGYPNEAAATAVILLIFVLSLNLLAALCGKLIQKKYGDDQ